MKKHVVTASLLAGFSMISGNAFAQTGTVGASWSHLDADGGGSADTVGVDGGVTIPTGGNVAVLLNGGYSTSDDLGLDTLSGTAHLISRDANGAFGGFVGLTNWDAGVGDVNSWTVGGEYAAFMGNNTFAATLSYATFDDTDLDIWSLGGEYRIFASDDLRFDLGAGYGRVDTGVGDGDGFQLGAGAEYRFAGSPISLGGNVTYFDTDVGNVTSLGVTLRFDFGNDSLKARDRSGNTFNSTGFLPQLFL